MNGDKPRKLLSVGEARECGNEAAPFTDSAATQIAPNGPTSAELRDAGRRAFNALKA
jgi:hypothetical protein